tara:strand:+ start:987 stop:1166 length:180 start_codon:yes stop_codon:yes gene_type:complete
MTISTITQEEFHHFVKIQHSGEYNMVDSAVADIIGIDSTQHMFILRNYEELEQKYGSGE